MVMEERRLGILWDFKSRHLGGKALQEKRILHENER